MSTQSTRLPRRLYSRAIGILTEKGYAMDEIVEISEGGLMVKSKNHEFTQNMMVLLNFFLPTGNMIIVRAEVRWVKEVIGMPEQFAGFQFTRFAFQHRRHIRGYVAEKQEVEIEYEKYKMNAPDQPILLTKEDSRPILREAVRK